MTATGLVVWSREGCELCDDFAVEVAAACLRHEAPFEIRDVDADPDARRRYGLKVPVLTFDGHVICAVRFDAGVVETLLARRRA